MLTLLFFVFFLVAGIVYLFDYRKSLNRKKLVIGVLFLAFGWLQGASFLQTYYPDWKFFISVSEVIVSLGAAIFAAIMIKKWRYYILVGLFILVVIIALSYIYLQRGLLC